MLYMTEQGFCIMQQMKLKEKFQNRLLCWVQVPLSPIPGLGRGKR